MSNQKEHKQKSKDQQKIELLTTYLNSLSCTISVYLRELEDIKEVQER